VTYLPVSPSSHELLGDTSGDSVVGDTSPKFCNYTIRNAKYKKKNIYIQNLQYNKFNNV